MKKTLALIIFALNFLPFYGQKDSLSEDELQVNVDKIIFSIDSSVTKIEKYVVVLENRIDSLNNCIINYSKKGNYDNIIDSLDMELDRTENIIEILEESIEDLESQKDELIVELKETPDNIININDVELSVWRKKFKGHWFGMQLGLNTYIDNNQSFKVPEKWDYMSLEQNKSWYFSLNIIQFSFPLFSDYIGGVTGIGFDFFKYELYNNVVLDINNDKELTFLATGITYKKNCFKTYNLNVPLIVEFQIPIGNDNRIHIGAGVIGSLNLYGKMKTVHYNDNNKIKNKDSYSKWPISTFNYQATLRVGFENIYAFANYSFEPLFKKGQGPELYPVVAGIGVYL